MKKLFLLLAFTGIVGAASATSVLALSHNTIVNHGGDDKKGDDKKKKKDKKECCKKDANAKTCTHDDKKSCCKAKTETKAKPATATPPTN